MSWPLRIICINSTPASTHLAARNDLKLSIRLVTRFTARWPCRAMLFEGADATRLAAGQDAASRLTQAPDEARLALCSEILGASRALNALTLAYLKDRRQFGRPIGTNLALQHRMVEIYMLEEKGRCVINAAHRAAPPRSRRWCS